MGNFFLWAPCHCAIKTHHRARSSRVVTQSKLTRREARTVTLRSAVYCSLVDHDTIVRTVHRCNVSACWDFFSIAPRIYLSSSGWAHPVGEDGFICEDYSYCMLLLYTGMVLMVAITPRRNETSKRIHQSSKKARNPKKGRRTM